MYVKEFVSVVEISWLFIVLINLLEGIVGGVEGVGDILWFGLFGCDSDGRCCNFEFGLV